METQNGYGDYYHQPQNGHDHAQFNGNVGREAPMNADSHGYFDTDRSENFQKELEDYITRYKKEKVARLFNEKEEKKEALEQLKSYNPWGRPGGGAPKEIGNQKMCFTEYDTAAPTVQKEVPGLQFRGEGGGDPLKTNTGHPRTEVVSDPDTRCRDYRYSHPLRYANSKESAQDLKLALQRGMEDRAFREEQDRRSRLEMEHLMVTQYDPFGKPGAGAPLSQRDLHPPKQTSLDIGSAVGNGAPIRNDEGSRVTKLKQTMGFKHGQKTVEQTELFEEPKPPHFGSLQFPSPGAGNPNFDSKGNLIAGLQSLDFNREDRLKKMKVAERLAKEADSELASLKLRKLEEEQRLRQPNDRTFQEIMDSLQFGKPKRDPQNGLLVSQHRVSTDVSQPRPSPRQNKELSNTLKRQMAVSQTDRQLEKMNDRYKAQQHYVAFPDRFDRANLDDVHYKNFDRILHNMPHGQIAPQSHHNFNTVRQYHHSYYQLHNPEVSSGYAPLPPFATHERAAQSYR